MKMELFFALKLLNIQESLLKLFGHDNEHILELYNFKMTIFYYNYPFILTFINYL
jgi:hypothetical protein